MAVEKVPGDPVTGSTVNGPGQLLMKARQVGRRRGACPDRCDGGTRNSRAPMQALADRVVAAFVSAARRWRPSAFIV